MAILLIIIGVLIYLFGVFYTAGFVYGYLLKYKQSIFLPSWMTCYFWGIFFPAFYAILFVDWVCWNIKHTGGIVISKLLNTGKEHGKKVSGE